MSALPLRVQAIYRIEQGGTECSSDACKAALFPSDLILQIVSALPQLFLGLAQFLVALRPRFVSGFLTSKFCLDRLDGV